MKNICKNIGYAVLVLGTIGSIYLANKLGVSLTGLIYSHYERDWGQTIVIFLTGFASSGITSVIFLALSEILEKLEFVTYNTTPNNEPSLFEQISEENTKKLHEKMLAEGGWKCAHCGRVNHQTVGSCACGAVKEY